jgi:alkylhydroperoxidase family enzyme
MQERDHGGIFAPSPAGAPGYRGGVQLTGLPTEDVLDLVLADLPDVRQQLELAHDEACATVAADLLEPCRARIAMLLGCRDELEGLDADALAALAGWPTSDRFDERQRACLALTEQFVIDVASTDDELVAAVRDHLGDVGLLDFVSALLVVEQRQRLRLTWERIFEDPS